MTSDGFDLTIANSKSDRLFETLCHDSEWLKTERPDIKAVIVRSSPASSRTRRYFLFGENKDNYLSGTARDVPLVQPPLLSWFIEMSDSTEENTAAQEKSRLERENPIQRCIESFIHAGGCTDENCERKDCAKVMKLIRHVCAKCAKNSTDECQVCKHAKLLSAYHARSCNAVDCTMPFCAQLRQKLIERKAFYKVDPICFVCYYENRFSRPSSPISHH
ncbi:hypothetical protein PRIPAC_93709 [Pristionchus pacificus]|uniref:histone acetyltransferase n=1 Tax=Pristionchus pacificus TaxID=54126 RepID=A0A2A6BBM3_PRIPA|nr:hypothetical protein PRIPAC_93709 [Pristionchus pacificus]|eukprot:PDM63266.1 hypothetical protein PRIPAC_50481 [Pristionchus pacificus]